MSQPTAITLDQQVSWRTTPVLVNESLNVRAVEAHLAVVQLAGPSSRLGDCIGGFGQRCVLGPVERC
jgi:hypothetical protein